MQGSIFTSGDGDTEAISQPQALKAVLYSGLAVGVLDGLAATISAGLRGVSPINVFQYVASGLLGRSAFEGGLPIALFGVLLHFVVAFGASVVFFAASRFLPFLTQWPFIVGPLYGIAVFFAMRDIVVPMSLITRTAAPTVASIVTGIVIHILFVGLPIALITRHFAGVSEQSA